MTHETETLIVETVRAKVNDDEMFTAFDVSRIVQARQEEDGIPIERHRNMKDFIHDMMEQYVDSGLFEKTLCDVGAPSPAFIYHPAGTDTNGYIPQNRAQPVNQPVNQPVKQFGQNGHRGDARGTLAVPSQMVRSAEFHTGDIAYVSNGVRNGEQVLIIKKYPDDEFASYTVDSYDNIRITHSTLSSITDQGAGIDTFDFEVDGNTIVVSKN